MVRRRTKLVLLLLLLVGGVACGDDGGVADEEQFAPPEESAEGGDDVEVGGGEEERTDETGPDPSRPEAGPAVATFCDEVDAFVDAVNALVGQATQDLEERIRLTDVAREISETVYPDAIEESSGSDELVDCQIEFGNALDALGEAAGP